MGKATLYEITGDLIELNKLMENLVDENGEPREPTEKELETMKDWFTETYDEFKTKFDNYCKFIKNLKLSAENAESEKNNFKAENSRLTKRAKAYANREKLRGGVISRSSYFAKSTFTVSLLHANLQRA